MAEKSFAVGAIAETLHACGPASSVLAPKLYPLFMDLLHDEDDEVRNNAIFAIGVLAANCGQQLGR